MSRFAFKLWNFAFRPDSRRNSTQNYLRTNVRLLLETLEDRCVPAGNAQGIITGAAFIDINENGTFDAEETTLPGGEVRLTGTTNTGEAVNAIVPANGNGVYVFDNVNPGNYQVNSEGATGFLPSGSGSGNFVVNEGATVTRDVGFSTMTAQFVSLRQFLTTTTSADFYSNLGSEGTTDVARSNDSPFLSTAIPDQTIPKNVTETIDLAGFFSDDDFTDSSVQFNLRVNNEARNIKATLFDTSAAKTVANFFNYILDNDYDNSIFHRLVNGFALQGGGFTFNSNPSTLDEIPSDPPVENEFDASNTEGTIAMAKLDGDPNSATNEFFFNLANNDGSGTTSNLDTQNGGFTVFGEVDEEGMDVLDDLNADLNPSDQGAPFDEIPLVNYNGTNFPTDTMADNFVLLEDIEILQRDEFLSYEVVSNDNPGLLSASIDHNRLVIEPVTDQVGEANLTVRATDRFGASVEATFKVTVED